MEMTEESKSSQVHDKTPSPQSLEAIQELNKMIDPFIQDHIKTNVDPVIQEHINKKIDQFIQDHIKTKVDLVIQDHIKTKVDPAIQEYIATKKDTFIQDHIKTKVDPAIQEYIATKKDPFIKDHITTKIDPAIQEHIDTQMDPFIQDHIETLVYKTIEQQIDTSVQKHFEKNIDPAIRKYLETKIEKRNMQTVITLIIVTLLGGTLAGCWRLQSNMNDNITDNITILSDRIIHLHDKGFGDNVTVSIKILQEKLFQCQTNITLVKEELLQSQTNITKVKEELLQSLKKVKEELFQSQTDINKVKEELFQSRTNSTKVNTVFQEKLLQCQTNITKVKDELLQCQTNISKMMDNHLYIKRDMQVLEGQEEIRNSKTISSDTVLILLVCTVVFGFILLIIKYTLLNRKEEYTDMIHNNEMTQMTQPTSSELLEQVELVSLNSSVCIISFYKETQDLHLKLAKSAIQTDIPVKQFLMKSPEAQLMSIPRSRFILVFIDYSERNVILETPGQDLGDKKKVTVQAAQKMGGDVIVVYVRDKGSTNLPDGALYNTNLQSFTRHPILKKLTVRERGLSVYETFTDYQKSHLNGIIRSNSNPYTY